MEFHVVAEGRLVSILLRWHFYPNSSTNQLFTINKHSSELFFYGFAHREYNNYLMNVSGITEISGDRRQCSVDIYKESRGLGSKGWAHLAHLEWAASLGGRRCCTLTCPAWSVRTFMNRTALPPWTEVTTVHWSTLLSIKNSVALHENKKFTT